jgi:hypothetical protein
MIDGFRDSRNAMIFLTNPYGVQRDVLSFDDRYFDVEWDGLWKVRTQQTDSGWIAEFAIPWKTLRYSPGQTTFQTWGINFCRQKRSTNEVYAWSPYPRAYSWARMNYEGIADSLHIPAAGTNIRVQPYVLFSTGKQHRNEKRETSIKAGGEVKWAIKPDKILDLTFNTDFAQTDVDQFVNNVQRFSVSFPERRQFFLENAGLFGAGLDVMPDGNKSRMTILPFFSRRIGLDEKGNPIPIDAGARYVQRSDRQNIGAMVIRQAAGDSISATNFFAGRYTHTIGKQNQIGALITSRLQENAPGKPMQGYTNWSGTVDGFFRLNQKLQWNGMISGSMNDGKKGQGASGYSQLFYKDDFIAMWWNESFVSPSYNPEAGFVNRFNAIATSIGTYLTARHKWLPKSVRSFGPAILFDMINTFTTRQTEEAGFEIYPFWFNFHKGGYAGFSWKYQYQQLRERFEPLNTKISPGKYRYGRLNIYYATDASKKWSANFQYGTGGFFDGSLQYGNVTTRFSPIPHLSLTAGIELNKLSNAGIEKLNDTYYLYNIQARLSINPRIQAFIFYQHNTVNTTEGLNAKFSWEYKPLSFVYFVINNRGMITNNLKDRSEQAIFKFSYMKQF